MIAQNLVVRVLLLLVFGIGFYFGGATFVSAQTIPATELDGYAWSSNIGWISLNCQTGSVVGGDICATANYKVAINADRTITGYAWSSNIGWIRFGGLSSYPTGGGTAAVPAQVIGTYPNLTFAGWARACAGTNEPNASEQKDCSSMNKNDNSGDWDGWISLQGTNYQITTSNSGLVSGSYAWGSDVVGWVDMSSYVAWLKPSATLFVSGCRVAASGTDCMATTTWNITNGSAPYQVRNITTGDVFSTAVSGTNQLQRLQLGSNTVEVRDAGGFLTSAGAVASCVGGTVPSGSTCVTPPPTITMTLSKSIARVGDAVTATWTITPTPLASGSCTLSGPGLSGTTMVGGTQISTALTSKSRFGITCTGGYGTVEASATVEIIPAAQEV